MNTLNIKFQCLIFTRTRTCYNFTLLALGETNPSLMLWESCSADEQASCAAWLWIQGQGCKAVLLPGKVASGFEPGLSCALSSLSVSSSAETGSKGSSRLKELWGLTESVYAEPLGKCETLSELSEDYKVSHCHPTLQVTPTCMKPSWSLQKFVSSLFLRHCTITTPTSPDSISWQCHLWFSFVSSSVLTPTKAAAWGTCWKAKVELSVPSQAPWLLSPL